MGNISVIDWILRSYTVGDWFTNAGVDSFPFVLGLFIGYLEKIYWTEIITFDRR